MAHLIPHLWFQDSLSDIYTWYSSVFSQSQELYHTQLGGTPSGTVEMAAWRLEELEIRVLSASAPFHLTPAFSFLVACSSPEEVDEKYRQLSVGGKILMPLASYSFSPRYAWVVDRYGLSWQLMDFSGRKVPQRLIPTLMFTSQAAGQCEQALRQYCQAAQTSAIDHLDRYGSGLEPNLPQHIRHATFQVENLVLAAMDSSAEHDFSFSEAASLVVQVSNQRELDHWWQALSADPEAERCGWLKDQFGVSWQIVPEQLEALMSSPDEAARGRVRDAFLAMKKLDITTLEQAAQG